MWKSFSSDKLKQPKLAQMNKVLSYLQKGIPKENSWLVL
jgi:hypothetical protein